MAVFIAGLILIGVLVAGGEMADKGSTGETQIQPTAGIVETAVGDAYLACGDAGPRQRDLTVPYVSRSTGGLTTPEGQADCRDE